MKITRPFWLHSELGTNTALMDVNKAEYILGNQQANCNSFGMFLEYSRIAASTQSLPSLLSLTQSGVPICKTLFYGDITLGQHGATNLKAFTVFLFSKFAYLPFPSKSPFCP